MRPSAACPTLCVGLWGCRNSTSPPQGGAPGLLEGGRKGWEALCTSLNSTGEKAGFPREGKFNLGAWLGPPSQEVWAPTGPQATLALPTPGADALFSEGDNLGMALFHLLILCLPFHPETGTDYQPGQSDLWQGIW